METESQKNYINELGKELLKNLSYLIHETAGLFIRV